MKIFIGTKSETTETLTSALKNKKVEVTSDQNAKASCDYLLYAATADLEGVNHIIDAVNDSNHWKEKTIFCTLENPKGKDFNEHQKKSLVATGKMVRVNGGSWFESETELLNFINQRM